MDHCQLASAQVMGLASNSSCSFISPYLSGPSPAPAAWLSLIRGAGDSQRGAEGRLGEGPLCPCSLWAPWPVPVSCQAAGREDMGVHTCALCLVYVRLCVVCMHTSECVSAHVLCVSCVFAVSSGLLRRDKCSLKACVLRGTLCQVGRASPGIFSIRKFLVALCSLERFSWLLAVRVPRTRCVLLEESGREHRKSMVSPTRGSRRCGVGPSGRGSSLERPLCPPWGHAGWHQGPWALQLGEGKETMRPVCGLLRVPLLETLVCPRAAACLLPACERP